MWTTNRILVLQFVVACSHAYVTRPVPCTFSGSYLDVMVAIDYSNVMGVGGIHRAVNDVASLFSETKISQLIGQYTRIGVMSYTDSIFANRLFDIDHFNSTQQFVNEIFTIVPATTSAAHGTLSSALRDCDTALVYGNQHHYRDNVPQVIILYVTENREGGLAGQANLIKATGVTIIAVDCSAGQNLDLSAIASPGMVFRRSKTDYLGDLRSALCKVNAQCQTGWTQVYNQLTNEPYGECLWFSDAFNWNQIKTSAAVYCNQKGGYLVSIFDANKNKFTMDAANDRGIFGVGLGLTRNGTTNNFQWDQMPGQRPLPLLPGDYAPWGMAPDPVKPNVYLSTPTCTWASCTLSTDSADIVVCQKNTCDTANYC